MSLGSRINAELRGDPVIWVILALLATFSIVIVYSSTGTLAFQYHKGDTGYFLTKHLLLLGLGLFMTYVCYLMHPMRYSKMAASLFLVAIPMLVYTLALEGENYGRRWIEIPYVGITFQTSDFARLALIIYLAKALSITDYIRDFNSAFMPIIVPVIVICGLIAPADLSTAVLLFTTCMLMMFIGRVDMKYIALLVMCGVVVLATLIILADFEILEGVIRRNTWVSRLQEFNSNEGGYQIQHSMMAIASGHLFGLGPGNSLLRNSLPNPYNDFIFSTICEEYGLLGGMIIIFLFLLLLFRVARLVTNSNKGFSAMLALGLTLAMVIQALMNMAVAVHLVPVTGLNMPVVSYGGTSLIFSCISFGIILSVSKNIEKLSLESN